MSTLYYESSFAHHGILGMKWGVRRYQNKDGSLTPRGQKRYQKEMEKIARSQNEERRRVAMEQARIREARKTAQAKAKLLEEKAALRDDKRSASHKHKSKYEQEKEDQAEAAKRKRTSEMSNEELAKMIQRIQLENQLRTLTTPPKKEVNPMLKDFGKLALNALATESAKAIGTGLTRMLTEDSDRRKREAELNKQKAEWKRLDDIYRRDRIDKIDDEESRRKWEAKMASDKWENERKTRMDELDWELRNPYFVPANKRSWKSEKKKDDDDDD